MMRKLAVLVCLLVLAHSPASAETGAWELIVKQDRMTGEVTKYVVSDSKNIVRSRHREGRILLGYACGGGLYLRANDLGFQIDDYSARVQYARVKFDDEPPEGHYFYVWDDNHDGMSLVGNSLLQMQVVEQIRTAKTMLIEVELSFSKGAKEIAEFDLTGFSVAITQC